MSEPTVSAPSTIIVVSSSLLYINGLLYFILFEKYGNNPWFNSKSPCVSVHYGG